MEKSSINTQLKGPQVKTDSAVRQASVLQCCFDRVAVGTSRAEGGPAQISLGCEPRRSRRGWTGAASGARCSTTGRDRSDAVGRGERATNSSGGGNAGNRFADPGGIAHGFDRNHRADALKLLRRSARPISVGSAMTPRRSARSVVRLSRPRRSRRRRASDTEGRDTLRYREWTRTD
jgi:hypothetical protein